MTDATTARVSRFALIGSALLAMTAIGARAWHDATPTPAPQQAEAGGDDGAMIGSLEARLKANPTDAEGWRMLGWTMFQSQRFDESAIAYGRATQLAPLNGGNWSALGEALVMSSAGNVTPRAKSAFDRAVAIDPADPRARYFLGVAQDMRGDHKGAIDAWFALLKVTPAGASWDGDVRRTIEQVGKKNHIDVAARLAAIRPGPPDADAAPESPGSGTNDAAPATAQIGQQDTMIAGMVATLAGKLKADPKNVEGWIMLMRSYVTLGRANEAAAAYRAARLANPSAAPALDSAARALSLATE